MHKTPAQIEHWRANRRLSALLLSLWLAVTLGVTYFADVLNQVSFIGPLGFYMAAQGALLIYLAIIGIYALGMRRIDARYGPKEQASL
jgi:putative solute:sodium symporter small subunit